MKPRYINLIWGLALVIAGALFLAQNLGIIPDLSPQLWVAFFTALSLVFFASYFASGVQQWWWLLPACVTASLALTISLGTAGINESYVGAPIFAGVAIPFFVAYALDKTRWWALIPAWVMSLLMVIVIIADRAQGELVGTLVLWGIGLPFLFVYLNDRSRWWALIPAGVMGVTGLFPLLAAGLPEAWIGPAVMLVMSLPFLVVYFVSQKNWWALIPAGIFVGISIVAAMSGDETPNMPRTSLMVGTMFIVWGATFGILWLRRAAAPTSWAIYPAGVLAAMGLIAITFGANTLNTIWPLFIIAIGVIVLFRALRKPTLQ